MSMFGVRVIARVGFLVAGMGVGAAVAATPGIASADSLSDPFSWLAGLDPFPAAGAPALDLQISIDGHDLLPTTDNSATATSGMGDIAIAFGSGSTAQAGVGTDLGEPLSPGEFDIAVANGTDSFAASGVGNFDSAFANGTSSFAAVGGFNGVLSNGDLGMAWGPSTDAESGVFSTVPGGNDVALVVDPFGTLGSSASAGDGKFDLASVFGDGSTASVGMPGNYDLAAIFGDGLTSTNAQNGDFLYDLLTPFGDLPGTAASTGGNFLADMLSLF
jgi:hypothetical protein